MSELDKATRDTTLLAKEAPLRTYKQHDAVYGTAYEAREKKEEEAEKERDDLMLAEMEKMLAKAGRDEDGKSGGDEDGKTSREAGREEESDNAGRDEELDNAGRRYWKG